MVLYWTQILFFISKFIYKHILEEQFMPQFVNEQYLLKIFKMAAFILEKQ